ncbi:acid phosphatase 1-like isoform X2 [Lotus japonicus]|uniref:acid phosphatase 1-like isoform X2 n=1 Tax=Lotus japonicus TaxID=34305 RepID=UPI0025839323|nr:acid phosphatase 1-like isoform X2 [Lotus japonicus]
MMLKIKMVQKVVQGLTFFLELLSNFLQKKQPGLQNNKQQVMAKAVAVAEEADDERYGLSWRLAVEMNNVRPWRTVPDRCYNHVKNYMTGGQYERDLQLVTEQILLYASEITRAGDGFDAWILDVDDTCISNMTYYRARKFGCKPFDSAIFKAWIMKGICPANQAILGLFKTLKERGFKVFLLTGRYEATLGKITTDNLHNQGFIGYERLILRTEQYIGQRAVRYKSAIRKEIEGQGYRIWGNVGDQWSDLQGECLGNRTFKIPNPMYHIS